MNGHQVACTVGPYELLDRLGSGSAGQVYRARIAGEGPAALAIKVVPLQSPQRSAQRQRFLREAQTATRLRHPHILPVYDYGESNGQLYLVMKLVEGGTLADRIAQVPLPVTGGWQAWTTVSAPVRGASGIRDLYVVFTRQGGSGGLGNLNWFRFRNN